MNYIDIVLWCIYPCQITPGFFAGLSDQSLQQSVLSTLVDVLLATRLSEVTVKVKECVGKVWSYTIIYVWGGGVEGRRGTLWTSC